MIRIDSPQTTSFLYEKIICCWANCRNEILQTIKLRLLYKIEAFPSFIKGSNHRRNEESSNYHLQYQYESNLVQNSSLITIKGGSKLLLE